MIKIPDFDILSAVAAAYEAEPTPAPERMPPSDHAMRVRESARKKKEYVEVDEGQEQAGNEEVEVVNVNVDEDDKPLDLIAPKSRKRQAVSLSYGLAQGKQVPTTSAFPIFSIASGSKAVQPEASTPLSAPAASRLRLGMFTTSISI
jgi:hypothetical protein